MKLKLTSPTTSGDDVRKLQTELKKKGWLQGSVDGVYGPDTARAVSRGKYWLGYRVPDQTAADLFYDYLTGRKKTTDAMQARVRQRKKADAGKPMRLKMLAEARKHIGTKESPAGSNNVSFSRWYGMRGPWCAMFVSWCGVQAGSKFFRRGSRWAYVPYMVADGRAGRNGLAVTYDPKEGDIVTFDWEGGGSVADHVGFFLEWTNKSRTKFKALEGNTGIGNNSNGGEVMVRDRTKSQVEAFIHVGG